MSSYPASPAQIAFINSLLSDREVPAATRSYVETLLAEGVTKSRASDAITHLKAFPRAIAQQSMDLGVTERARPSEEGFYLVDQKVFKLVTSREGRLYAKQATARGLEYVPGAMARIFADQKLSPEQVVAQGLEQGFCIVCSSEFEDPTSKHIGIGPVCGKGQLGPEAYKALRATVADKPDVIAYEAAKKAAAKERRDAKKLAAAQGELELV